MLTLIHGSDIAHSRTYFQEERQRLKDSVLLDADAINLTDLAQVFDGGGLFGETKYLFIEQFLTKRKKSSDFDHIVKQLEKYGHEHTIILWEGKELDRGALNVFKTATVKAFKLPQTLFQLLDSLQPGNGKLLIKLFHKTIQTSETEMIFFMLVRQVRILLALSSASQTQIDEVKRLAPWQRGKLEKQASLFKGNTLIELYNKLFALEIGQKTGTLSSPLVSAIDFLLLEV
jgi:hypothetical protein